MSCRRLETDGMRFLDGEMSSREKALYEQHVRECDDCTRGLKEMGRIVELTNEVVLKAPDEEFWDSYWRGVHRRLERGVGFFLLILGLVSIVAYGIYRAVTSPEFFTFKGLAVTALLVGLAVVFMSVIRERFHEHKSDPYKGVRR